MAWEDPLSIGRNKNRKDNYKDNYKRSIKDDFADELPSFIQNVIIADWLSNMALAVIGEWEKMDFSAISSVLGRDLNKELVFFNDVKDMTKILDDAFLKMLKASFQSEGKKFDFLQKHFIQFKIAHLTPIFGTIIEDQEICELSLGAIEAKLAQGLPLYEVVRQRKYRTIILDNLEPHLQKEKNRFEDYAGGIITAFWNSAIKASSGNLTVRDCTHHRILLSRGLIPILKGHIEMLKLGYLQIIYGEEHKI